ncbi:MAG: efflux RND transporter permease subunit [Neomegalonema sp.]|nr:efflux RND transporter permease subunit [Neomegalonema sp.]
MNLAKLALENSRITVIALLGIVALGFSLLASYPSAEDPTITIRNASVKAYFPGMSAERVEKLLTIPLEAKMREISEIDEIESTSKPGETKLVLKIREDISELAPVFQRIRNKALDAQSLLPQGTQGPIVNDEEGLTAIATIALWSDGFSMAEMNEVAKDARELIYTLDGVRKVDILGAQDERIFLETSPSKLAGLGVSPREIFKALADQNIIQPGGQVVAGGRVVTLSPTGDFGSVEAIGNVLFSVPDSDVVLRVADVVDIRRGYVDPPQFPAFYNNSPAIILSVSTRDGVNNVEFGGQLKQLVAEFQQELPIGYVLDFATYQPELISAAVDGAINNVYQTLAIVLAVVVLFLGIRTGLIVGSFVPLTMLLGVIVMRYFEVELQRMSIAAMIIALGLLVDNGIVVAEDIRSRLERGIDRLAAASGSVSTLAVPLLTSSLTTIFAFLPMLLTEGAAGEYVKSLAQVVAILLLSSWVLAMTAVPVLCAWFMKAPAGATGAEPTYDGVVYRLYRGALLGMLRARFWVIGILVAMFVGAVQLLGTLKTEFFPLGDRNQLLVYLDFEAGTDQRETAREFSKLTAFLANEAENPEIASHVAYVGYGGPRFFLALSPVDPDPHRAFALINLKSVEDVGAVSDRVNAFIDTNLPTARGDAKRMWFGATEPGIVQISLKGADAEVMTNAAAKIEAAFYDVPGAVGIKNDWENRILGLWIEVDQARARRAGVTSADVAESLQALFDGAAISDYREGDKVIPIVLRGEESLRFSLTGLREAQVFAKATGDVVALEQVAKVRAEWLLSRIKRVDQVRTLTVESRHSFLTAPQLLEQVQPTLAALDLPAGHRWELDGEIADQAEANGNLFGLLPIAMAGIVILLVGQFNSIRKGGIVIATIPLILIGGTVGLVVMGAPFSFMVMLGFFSLAGILINNGIVLIDRIQDEESAGRDPLDAIVTACLARLRPIVMTTLTTVLGLVPLILFGGALFYGMASVIAFGLIAGTVFTLGFVPVLYSLLYGVSARKAPEPIAEAGAEAE